MLAIACYVFAALFVAGFVRNLYAVAKNTKPLKPGAAVGVSIGLALQPVSALVFLLAGIELGA